VKINPVLAKPRTPGITEIMLKSQEEPADNLLATATLAEVRGCLTVSEI